MRLALFESAGFHVFGQERGQKHSWAALLLEAYSERGAEVESGVKDPDAADPSRIFSWLLCAGTDGKGSAIVYSY